MKKRAALILALVMLTGVLVGLMPVSAAGVEHHYISLAPLANGGVAYTMTLAAEEEVAPGFNTSVVQVYGDKILGTGIGSTDVTVVNKASKAVTQIYHVTVSSTGSSTLADVTGATVILTMKTNTKDKYVFPGEKFTVTAKVTKDGADITSKVRYIWTLHSENGISGTIATSSNGSVATITLKSVDYSESGKPIKVSVDVYGKDNSKVLGTEVDSTAADIKACCGRVDYTYLDRDNGGVTINDPLTIGALPHYTNLGRTYTAPVGRAVGMIYYMSDASPKSVTFYPGSLLTYNIVAGVKKGTGSAPAPSPSTGYGYVMLPNGYVILESVENANNLAVMKPGSTQQITSAMLGGVPVNAPMMTYKIADPKIATVSSTGLITALSTGITTLEVYCNNQKVIYKYLFVLQDVEQPEEVEGLVIKPTSVTRKLATQKNVRFRVKAANITFNGVKVPHKNLEWSSSKTSVATVDANGYVRIRAKGTCYIYATYTDKDGEEYTARFKVTVK
ncbi:MAG: Ig-like domain-containing protein [Christensenellales bacterium]|jgi:archaellum component FlaF (FlaF/FlaG flagellin family)